MKQRPIPTLIALASLLLLPGCLAKAAVDVVTLPVRAAGSAVDAATTSQSEADEKRGREMRRREERLGELEHDYRRHSEQCANGNDRACAKARAVYDEIQQLQSAMPPARR